MYVGARNCRRHTALSFTLRERLSGTILSSVMVGVRIFTLLGSRLRFVVVIMALVFWAVPVTPALTESHGGESRYLSEYTRLRNLDPTGDLPVHATAWASLANRMNGEFLTQGESLSQGELVLAGDTNLRVWRVNRSPGYAARAATILDAAIARGPGSDHGEFALALILRGDAARAGGDPEEVARQFYEKALAADPSLVGVAKARMLSLSGSESCRLAPSLDLETPRLVMKRGGVLRGARKIVVIDPGHGGYDGGAQGANGLREKDVTLDLARKVKTYLEGQYPITVLLTREDDTFVPLARRTSFANKRRADAFVSIHLNASPTHTLHGLEAYYLDTADNEASRKLAERENGLPEGAALDDLSFILSDLIQSGKLEGSIELTHFLEAGVSRAAKPVYKGSRSYGVKKGPFFVLVGAHMPCSLLEVYFIDSPEDGAKLGSQAFRSVVAQGIGDGLVKFLLPSSDKRGPEPLSPKSSPNRKKVKRTRRV